MLIRRLCCPRCCGGSFLYPQAQISEKNRVERFYYRNFENTVKKQELLYEKSCGCVINSHMSVTKRKARIE